MRESGDGSDEVPTETGSPPGVVPAPRVAPPAAPPLVDAEDAPPLWIFHAGQRYRVGAKPFIIGRSKDTTDLRIPDTTITRHHARVEFVSGVYYIVDLGSLNGIEYNGELVARRAIEEGDVYALCGHELRFSYRDDGGF